MRKSTSWIYSHGDVREWISSNLSRHHLQSESSASMKNETEHKTNDYSFTNTCSSIESDGRRCLGLTGYARRAWRHLPLFLFVASIAIASFAYGALVGKYQLFPYSIAADGVKTLRTLLDTNEVVIVDDGRFESWVADVRPENAAGSRNSSVEGGTLGGSLLWYGGRFQFMELCPEWGCLAVEFTVDGEVAHAYPFRPHALEQAAEDAATDEFPFEFVPTFSFVRDVRPVGISRYPNGDLLVVFHINNDTSFPYGAGVARIDRAGHPVWFRRDYSHHWPQIEEDGSALVPGLSLGIDSISFQIRGTDIPVMIECDTGKPYMDAVNTIDGDGRLVESIDLMGALLDSPFAAILQHTRPRDGCDAIHLNSIERLGDDAVGAWGMSPGDLVVSMRNMSAFAILDGDSGRVKRVVRGSFVRQHAVRHLEGTRFLMFDNHGSDGTLGPSRLLMVDLADGQETTIFPNDRTPESLRGLFSINRGRIDISPDRRRALVVFSNEGVAVEVRLSDGAPLNVFRSLHDVSSLDQFSAERATQSAIFQIFGLDYIPGRESSISSRE